MAGNVAKTHFLVIPQTCVKHFLAKQISGFWFFVHGTWFAILGRTLTRQPREVNIVVEIRVNPLSDFGNSRVLNDPKFGYWF